MSVSVVAEIYTGDCAQEIANLYNALAEELCVRCTRVQQEIASKNEIDQLMKHETTRSGEDMATKVEIARITAQEEIESLACGVVYEILDIIFSQVEQSVEKSHDVMVRVKTPNEQAWDALKAKRENTKRAAGAHAAMLQAHSKAKADKLRAKHKRAVCKEIASSIIEEIVTSVQCHQQASKSMVTWKTWYYASWPRAATWHALSGTSMNMAYRASHKTIPHAGSSEGALQDGRSQTQHGGSVNCRTSLSTWHLGRRHTSQMRVRGGGCLAVCTGAACMISCMRA
jgi:hypothetical protein